MNIYIMTDTEGISGIFSSDQILEGGSRYMEGRSLLTEEINACVHACKEAGADKVYVRDGHGGANMILQERLTDEADYYICGRAGDNIYAGLEDCDAVILLGYHAMAGVEGAVLEHTYMSKRVQNYWLDGEKIGEIGMNAVGVGIYGKPIILVTGDDKACDEAKNIIPWAETAEVKKGLTWGGAMLMPVKKAHKLIAEKTKEAIANFGKMQTLKVPTPFTLRVELIERALMPTSVGKPYMKIIDGRTYEVTANTVEEALTLTKE